MSKFSKKNEIEELAFTIISSPKAVLTKLTNSDSENIEVTLFDCHGQQHTGSPIKTDAEDRYLLLLSSEANTASALSFIDINTIVSLKIHNPCKHLKILTGRDIEKGSQLNEDKEIDIEDYAVEVSNILKRNYAINMQFKLVDTSPSTRSKHQQQILLNTLKSILGDIAKDSYSAELIASIESIHIIQNNDKNIAIKRRNSAIHIRADLENPLPSKLPKLIEDGINRVL